MKIVINGVEAEVVGGSGGSTTAIKEVTLTSAGWSQENLQQTVTVAGIIANPLSQDIRPTPAPDSRDEYNFCEVNCIAQAENALIFSATALPETDLTVYVSITSANAGGNS